MNYERTREQLFRVERLIAETWAGPLDMNPEDEETSRKRIASIPDENLLFSIALMLSSYGHKLTTFDPKMFRPEIIRAVADILKATADGYAMCWQETYGTSLS